MSVQTRSWVIPSAAAGIGGILFNLYLANMSTPKATLLGASSAGGTAIIINHFIQLVTKVAETKLRRPWGVPKVALAYGFFCFACGAAGAGGLGMLCKGTHAGKCIAAGAGGIAGFMGFFAGRRDGEEDNRWALTENRIVLLYVVLLLLTIGIEAFVAVKFFDANNDTPLTTSDDASSSPIMSL